MFEALKLIAAEFAGSVIQPRIEKAKTDLKLAIVTGTVIVVFSLMALICLYVILFLHLSEYMLPENAALALFGFSLFMCLGAVLMYLIGRRVEQGLYERRASGGLRKLSDRIPDREDIDIAGYAHDLFAENKGAALIAAAVSGIVLGAHPGMVLRSLSKIIVGSKGRRRRRYKAR